MNSPAARSSINRPERNVLAPQISHSLSQQSDQQRLPLYLSSKLPSTTLIIIPSIISSPPHRLTYMRPRSPPHSPPTATPETDSDHVKSPDEISNELAVLEQLRRSVQKNLRLRPIAVTPSPPRSPTRPISSASIWTDFAPARSSSPASSIASPSIYYTPLSDPKSPLP